MGSFSHKFSIIQNQDLVCIFYGCRTLGYQEYGCFFRIFFDGSAQCRIRCEVQCGCTVIKDQDIRLADQCSRDGQTLSLSTGEVSSAGFHFFIQTFLFFLHHFFCLRDL